MYMHMNPQDGSSSPKKEKKDLALKASHKGKAKKIEVESSTSSDDDASIALSEKNHKDVEEAQQEWSQLWLQKEEILHK